MTGSDLGQLLVGVATLLTAISTWVTTRHTRRGVSTLNGLTTGELQERAEGRRILADIPEENRTPGEQGYVERLEDPETNPGQAAR